MVFPWSSGVCSLFIDNVRLYDLNVDAGVTDFVADIVQILRYENSSGIGLYNYYYSTIEDLRNSGTTIYKTSPIFEDVTMKILDKNGNIDNEKLIWANEILKPIINELSNAFISELEIDKEWFNIEVFRRNLYEINYEIAYRPTMLFIPINNLKELLLKGK